MFQAGIPPIPGFVERIRTLEANKLEKGIDSISTELVEILPNEILHK
jgi:hypothetical protein